MSGVSAVTQTAWRDQANVLLLRKGRVLNPASRLRYRWLRLRTGRSIALQEPDLLLGILFVAVKVITIPVLTMVDYALWPLALMTIARGKWYVVALVFNDVDATFDRIAEADSLVEIKQRRRELERTAP
jgi:hypothetical protein